MKEVIMKKMQTYVLCSLSAHSIQYFNTFTPLLYTYYVPGIPIQCSKDTKMSKTHLRRAYILVKCYKD